VGEPKTQLNETFSLVPVYIPRYGLHGVELRSASSDPVKEWKGRAMISLPV
jgi:hypothetical protein